MMKKIFFLSIVIASFSCNSSGSNSGSNDSTRNMGPIQNVNGNIPDSTNSGPISGSKRDSLSVDSSKVDSTRRK